MAFGVPSPGNSRSSEACASPFILNGYALHHSKSFTNICVQAFLLLDAMDVNIVSVYRTVFSLQYCSYLSLVRNYASKDGKATVIVPLCVMTARSLFVALFSLMFHLDASCSGVVSLALIVLCTKPRLTLFSIYSRNRSSTLAIFSDVHGPMISLTCTFGAIHF
jgi:hypothetical protein